MILGALTYSNSDAYIYWTDSITFDVRSPTPFGGDWLFGASIETTIDESPRVISGDSNIPSDTSAYQNACLAISFAPAEGGGASGSGSITAEEGTYTLTGDTVTLAILGHVAIDSGTYTLSGFDVGINRTGTNKVIGTTTGSYLVSGATTTFLSHGLRVQAQTAGSYALSGDTVTSGDGLLADAGSYAMTGADTNLVLVAGSGGGVAAYVDVTGLQMMVTTADASVTISGGIAVLVDGNSMQARVSAGQLATPRRWSPRAAPQPPLPAPIWKPRPVSARPPYHCRRWSSQRLPTYCECRHGDGIVGGVRLNIGHRHFDAGLCRTARLGRMGLCARYHRPQAVARRDVRNRPLDGH